MAVLCNCAIGVQHLILKQFCWLNAHWIRLFQGLQNNSVSGGSMQRRPLLSATFQRCRFNDKASAAIFTWFTNTKW
jgi:hypothetical protein